MSQEHKRYLKCIKKRKVKILLLQIFLIISLLVIWQIASDKGLINSFIFSSPSKVSHTILSLYQKGSLFHHIWVTIYEVIISFIISSFLGIIIAILLWWFPTIAEVLEPYFTVLNSLPKVALGPIILIWFGANMKSIIFMAMLVCLIVAILNIYQGFKNIDKQKWKLMKSLGASKSQMCFYFILPSNIETIMSTLKLNISMCLIGVIMGEFLVSKEGIGYLIMYGSQVFNLNLVISGIFLLSLVATMLYFMITFFERQITKRRD